MGWGKNKISPKRLIVIFIGVVLILAGVVGTMISVLSQPKPFALDGDQRGEFELIDISGEEYEQLVREQKSFLVLVDQDGCITAAGLKGIVEEIGTEKGVKVYRLMFAEARMTSLYESVKFYPSLAIVEKGKVVSWLKADADEDTERYKDKTELLNWLTKYIDWS